MSAGPARDPDAILPPETAARRRIDAFARFLDDGMEIPGIGVRFGWDSLLGLVPGVGDLASFALSLYLVIEALRAGAPASVMTRIIGNIAADTAIGAIPVAGDILDVGFKANRRNANLLLNWMDRPLEVRRRSRVGIVLAVLGLSALAFAMLTAAIAVALWLISLIESPG